MTAEYSLLPASTGERAQREASRGQAGRAHGRDPAPDRARAPRGAATSRRSASGRSGSTATSCRPTAARAAPRSPARTSPRAARSTASASRRRCPARWPPSRSGSSTGRALLDLDYAEDSRAETDMNVVMTGDGRLVEVQATAERDPFSREQLDELLDLAAGGIEQIAAAQERGGGRRRVAPELEIWEALLRLARRRRARRRDRAGARAPRPGGRLSHAPARRARRLRLHAGLRVRLDGLDVLDARRHRLRPDAHRRADRHRHRLPRRGRDHRARHQRPRAHHGRDALGRRGDRDGRGHRLLRRRGRGDRARARLARPAEDRQRADALARAAGGGRARDRSRPGRASARRVLAADRGGRRRDQLGRVRRRGDDWTWCCGHRAAPSRRASPRRSRTLDDVERVQWRP